MSIASELTNLAGYIGDAYDAVADKGGTMPTDKNMANLAPAIAAIPGLDISAYRGCTKVEVGIFSPHSPISTTNTITHSMGVTPKLMAMYCNTLPAGSMRYYIQDLVCQTSTKGGVSGTVVYNLRDIADESTIPSGMVTFSSTSVTISSSTYEFADGAGGYMYILIG